MRISFLSAPLMAALALSLTACDNCTKCEETPAPETGLAGTWTLTGRQCFCPAIPQNGSIVFTGTDFYIYEHSLLRSHGTYDFTTNTLCGGGTPVPVIRFTSASAGQTPTYASYTLTNNKLTLDYGGPCDAPVDTYSRQQ